MPTATKSAARLPGKDAPAGEARKRVFILDDHPIFRAGLVQQINRAPGLEVCGEAGTAGDALRSLEKLKPDILLADLNLPDKSGIELIKDLQTLMPGLPALVLSMHDESFYAERVLRAGGRGYVAKQAGFDILLEAIQRVLSGRVYVSEHITDRIFDAFSGQRPLSAEPSVTHLTDRELEVFNLIGMAVETHEIARRLHMSFKTVEAHRANIKRKLKLTTAAELMRHAVLWAESGG